MDGYLALRGAHDRARELDRRVTELRMENERLRQQQLENDRLLRLLSLAEATPQRRWIAARVIGVGMGPAGFQTLTLDRGSDDGVVRMMPVVVADGVVGRIGAVTGRTADVLLVIDRNSSIAVRVERTRARANVRGNGKPGSARLDYALRSEDMIEGDRLVTSGTDGVFPRGLLVGTVTGIQRRPHGLFQSADVIPAVDPTRAEEVLVITAVDGADEAPAPAAPASASPGPAPQPPVASPSAGAAPGLRAAAAAPPAAPAPLPAPAPATSAPRAAPAAAPAPRAPAPVLPAAVPPPAGGG